jgi:hypothetical protein
VTLGRVSVAALLLLGLLSGAHPALAREWHFDVTVDGLPVGTHDLVLRENGDSRSVQSDMRYGFTLLGMSYTQHAEEVWKADCLMRLDTRTEERGNTITVTGRLGADGFVVDGPRGHAQLSACVMTFAYWNPNVLRQTHLVNLQTGVWTPVTVHELGKDSIDVRGASRVANHFRIDTERNRIELWYSPESEWLGLRSTTRDGHVLTYRLR